MPSPRNTRIDLIDNRNLIVIRLVSISVKIPYLARADAGLAGGVGGHCFPGDLPRDLSVRCTKPVRSSIETPEQKEKRVHDDAVKTLQEDSAARGRKAYELMLAAEADDL